MLGLLGKKIGMTQVFDTNGNMIPVTVVEAGPLFVTQIKTVETDGYNAVQVAFGDLKESRATSLLKVTLLKLAYLLRNTLENSEWKM